MAAFLEGGREATVEDDGARSEPLADLRVAQEICSHSVQPLCSTSQAMRP